MTRAVWGGALIIGAWGVLVSLAYPGLRGWEETGMYRWAGPSERLQTFPVDQTCR